MNPADAFHDVYRGETLDPFIAEREEAAFVAGYRRALEDAADEFDEFALVDGELPVTVYPDKIRRRVARWLRDRAAGVGTKDGDDDE